MQAVLCQGMNGGSSSGRHFTSDMVHTEEGKNGKYFLGLVMLLT